MASETFNLEELVRRGRLGDPAALKDLFRAVRSDLFRILRVTLGHDDEMEDLVQTAALEVFRALPSFRGDSKFSTFMYRIALHVAHNHLRRKRHQMAPESALTPEGTDERFDLPSPEANPEDRALQKEEVRIVREILDQIAPKKRLVFWLSEVDGLSPEEISEIVGAPRFTVKSRLSFARREFHKKLRQKAALLAAREKE